LYGFGALPIFRGYKGILTVQDSLTSFVKFIPIKNKTAKHIMERLKIEWMEQYGVPKEIHMDNAKEFIKMLQDCLNKWDIKSSYCGIYAHSQNGRVERVHRYLTDQLKVLKMKKLDLKEWPLEVYTIAKRYNSNFIEKLKGSPHRLVYGYEMEDNWEKQSNYRIEDEWIKQMDDRLRGVRESGMEEKQFTPGEFIFLQLPNEAKKYKYDENRGPFEVIGVLGNNTYTIWDTGLQKEVIVSSNHMRNCYSLNGEI